MIAWDGRVLLETAQISSPKNSNFGFVFSAQERGGRDWEEEERPDKWVPPAEKEYDFKEEGLLKGTLGPSWG